MLGSSPTPRVKLRAPTGRGAGSEQDDDNWQPSDADLDIGAAAAPPAASDDGAAARILEATSDPVIAQAIEQLVAQRVKEALGGAAPPAAGGVDLVAAMKVLAGELASAINRNASATIEQMPGHIKALPAEELEARKGAWVDLQAALRQTSSNYRAAYERGDAVEAERLAPIYLLEQDFFNGEDVMAEGDTIWWFGVPGTFMRPQNDIAKHLVTLASRSQGDQPAPSLEDVGVLYSQIGKPLPGSIFEQPRPDVPVLARRNPALPMAGRVDTPTQNVRPQRINGTMVQEEHISVRAVRGGPDTHPGRDGNTRFAGGLNIAA
jgi:hypothetical protein